MAEKDAMDKGQPNTLPTHMQGIKIGSTLLGGLATIMPNVDFTNAVTNGAQPSQLATLHVQPLDPCAKAATVDRVTVKAGSVTGELTMVAPNATPATTNAAVAPNGDIVVLAADAITNADVFYTPMKLEAREIELPVDASTGIALIPTDLKNRGVVYLHSAEALTGTVSGKKRILAPGAVNPATPQCRLSVLKDQINFTVADAITKVKVTLCIHPLVNTQKYLLGADVAI